MDTSAKIEVFLYTEVRYSIPTALLAILGIRAEIESYIGNHLAICNETLGDPVNVFLWRDVSRYIVAKIKFQIFELYSEKMKDAKHDPKFAELCDDYRDCDEVADKTLDDIKQTWRTYRLMRRS